MNSHTTSTHRRLVFHVAWAPLAGEEQGKGTWILLREWEHSLVYLQVCKLFKPCLCRYPALCSCPVENNCKMLLLFPSSNGSCVDHQQRHKWTSWLKSLTKARASSALHELISTSKLWPLWLSLACLDSPYRQSRVISAHVWCPELLWASKVLCGLGRCEVPCASSWGYVSPAPQATCTSQYKGRFFLECVLCIAGELLALVVKISHPDRG